MIAKDFSLSFCVYLYFLIFTMNILFWKLENIKVVVMCE